jgi:hypothetical protein
VRKPTPTTTRVTHCSSSHLPFPRVRNHVQAGARSTCNVNQLVAPQQLELQSARHGEHGVMPSHHVGRRLQEGLRGTSRLRRVPVLHQGPLVCPEERTCNVVVSNNQPTTRAFAAGLLLGLTCVIAAGLLLGLTCVIAAGLLLGLTCVIAAGLLLGLTCVIAAGLLLGLTCVIVT